MASTPIRQNATRVNEPIIPCCAMVPVDLEEDKQRLVVPTKVGGQPVSVSFFLKNLVPVTRLQELIAPLLDN